jgi:hypothetical protein
MFFSLFSALCVAPYSYWVYTGRVSHTRVYLSHLLPAIHSVVDPDLTSVQYCLYSGHKLAPKIYP